MILKNEVQRIAEQQGLGKSTIDKDWALGHLLNGIYQNVDCKKHWVFKGGTCLRKCYFPNYRFSEDLDFTVVDMPESYEFTYKNLNEILQQTAESSGIRFSISQHTTLLSKNQHVGYKSVVKFWGADHSK